MPKTTLKPLYSALVTFRNGKSKMEFSKSINKLRQLIFVENVVAVTIRKEDYTKPKDELVERLTRITYKIKYVLP